ncbi:hypothetical protein ACFQ3S_01475 [Mucilaginibacter terrae]|uniref:GH39 family glycosyl hydrolase n=1 Tax=Mucilaginibacter terrae TaxID=1955052 RepID=UPI00364079EE
MNTLLYKPVKPTRASKKSALCAVIMLGFVFSSCGSKQTAPQPQEPPVVVPPVIQPPISTALPVVIDFTRTADAGSALNQELIGGYSPQKWVNASKIYDKANVLDALSLPFSKVNLPNVTNIASDGTWNDINDGGQPSQRSILTSLVSAGVGIHLGIETVPAALRGDAAKVQKIFNTSLTKVRGYIGNDVEIYYEILNEPELAAASVEWGYYPDFELFWKDFLNAYIALANKRLTDPNLKIGGPGFELTRWMTQFISKLTDPATNKVQLSDGSTQTIDLDFISYHNYLNWDDNPIAQSNIQTAIDKMNTFYNAVAAYRTSHASVKLFCTEYSWLKSPFNAINDAANNSYRSCARTLELTKLAIEQLPRTNRFYWAQTMGQGFGGGDDYFTLQNYDWDSKKYRYRSGAYALWMYQRMPASRSYMTFDGTKLNGFASAAGGRYYLAVWNRTGTAQSIQLNLSNINTANLNYDMYAINSNTFNYSASSAFGNAKTPAITKTGAASTIGEITLEKEATIYIELYVK